MDAEHSRGTPSVLFHVSPSVNQESILEHGLDVSRMGAAHGIAGSTEPESAGIHLVDGEVDEALWYASFGHHPRVDTWQVDASGLPVEETEDGWLCREVISPARLTLLESGVTPDQAEGRLDLPAMEGGGFTGYLKVVFKDPRRHPERQDS